MIWSPAVVEVEAGECDDRARGDRRCGSVGDASLRRGGSRRPQAKAIVGEVVDRA